MRTILLPLLGVFAVGCGTTASVDDGQAAEADLASAVCPAAISVELDAPSLKTDAQIKANIRESIQGTAAETDREFSNIAPWIAAARSQTAQSLTGTRQQYCGYKLKDAAGNQKFYGWFAKSQGPHGQYSLRITTDIGDGHAEHGLFISLPLTNVSPTEVTADPSRKGYLAAQDTTDAHSERPDGFSYTIASAKGSVSITE